MLEISPVVAGTYDTPDYVAATRNFNNPAPPQTADVGALGSSSAPASSTSATSDTPAQDPRRFTKFDRTAIEAGSTTMSFGDFLDMVNPLQHIPVVSSIYRAAEGESINPVSRVAGDLLYGGVFGVASAMLGGIGSVANSMIESQTGSDATGNVFATLFGTDKTDSSTQLASASAPGNAAALTDAPSLVPSGTTPVVSATLASATPALNSSGLPQSTAQAIPLATNKLPYGGVMDTSNTIKAQNTAIALSESSHAMRLGNTIYTGHLMNGPHPLPIASAPPSTQTASVSGNIAAPTAASQANAALQSTAVASAAPTSSVSQTTANAAAVTATIKANIANASALPNTPIASAQAAAVDTSATTAKNPIPDALIDDAVILKALNQYKGVAAGPASLGSNVNLTN